MSVFLSEFTFTFAIENSLALSFVFIFSNNWRSFNIHAQCVALGAATPQLKDKIKKKMLEKINWREKVRKTEVAPSCNSNDEKKHQHRISVRNFPLESAIPMVFFLATALFFFVCFYCDSCLLCIHLKSADVHTSSFCRKVNANHTHKDTCQQK